MDFVCKSYGNTYAVHVTVVLVGVATLNLALPAPLNGVVITIKVINSHVVYVDYAFLTQRNLDHSIDKSA